jgi:CMP/dCMP kinase
VNSAGPRLGNGVVVAVDGTSGSGKSSTSRGVARRLGLRYLDTGAMYRAVTWWMLRHAVEIRGDDVNAAVSPVSTVPRVRARMQVMQRAIIEDALAGAGIVVEGRDIGSVVWPDAPVKVYLSADAAARALRRAAEEGGSDLEATRESLLARDEIDSGRAVSPLVLAEGAVHVDTTDLTLDQAIDSIVAMVERVQDGVSAP